MNEIRGLTDLAFMDPSSGKKSTGAISGWADFAEILKADPPVASRKTVQTSTTDAVRTHSTPSTQPASSASPSSPVKEDVSTPHQSHATAEPKESDSDSAQAETTSASEKAAANPDETREDTASEREIPVGITLVQMPAAQEKTDQAPALEEARREAVASHMPQVVEGEDFDLTPKELAELINKLPKEVRAKEPGAMAPGTRSTQTEISAVKITTTAATPQGLVQDIPEVPGLLHALRGDTKPIAPTTQQPLSAGTPRLAEALEATPPITTTSPALVTNGDTMPRPTMPAFLLREGTGAVADMQPQQDGDFSSMGQGRGAQMTGAFKGGGATTLSSSRQVIDILSQHPKMSPGSVKELTLTLTPGGQKVEVRLEMMSDQIVARIAADPAVLDDLRRDAESLRQALEDAGVKADLQFEQQETDGSLKGFDEKNKTSDAEAAELEDADSTESVAQDQQTTLYDGLYQNIV